MLNKIKSSENVINKITTNVNMLVNPKNLSTSNISKLYKNLSTSNISKLYNKFSNLNMMSLYKNFSALSINKLYKNFFASKIDDVFKNNLNYNFNNLYNNIRYLDLTNEKRKREPLRLRKNHLKNLYSQYFSNKNIKFLSTATAPSVFSTTNISPQNILEKNISLSEVFDRSSIEKNIFPQTIFDRNSIEKNVFSQAIFDRNSIEKKRMSPQINFNKDSIKKGMSYRNAFYKNSIEKRIFPQKIFDRNIIKKNILPSRIFSKGGEILSSGIYKKSLSDNNILYKNSKYKSLSNISEQNIKFKLKDVDGIMTQCQKESGNINISPNINVELKPQNTITDFNRIWLEIGNRLNSELNSSACGIH